LNIKVKEWIKVLNKLDPEESICVHYWQIGDVLHMAEEMDEKVTNDEAQEILEEVEDNIDSEMGVSWTSISVGIEDLIKK
jgi:Ca2+-binding EF-hand superfamily protein